MHKKDNVGNTKSLQQLHQVLVEIKQYNRKYKSMFLVKQDESLIPIETEVFAYFNIKSDVVKGTTFNKESFVIDLKMKFLEEELNPAKFYRINRQFIIQRTAIKKISHAFNGKYTITLIPNFNEQILISKAKSRHFIEWIGKY